MNKEFDSSSLIIFQLGALHNNLYKGCGKIFREKEFPFEMDQIPVILKLYYRGEASQQEICAALQRDKASVNRTVAFLLKKEIVEVFQDEVDKRKTLVALTPTGKKLAAKASVILEEFDASISAALTKEEKKQFLSLTQKLIGTTTST